MTELRHLTVDLSEDTDGVGTVELMASTDPGQADAVDAEVQSVLDWAWRRFADSHGPLEEGHDWDHDLQVATEVAAGRAWRTVTLTLSGSRAFIAAFTEHFGHALD
jgi:hypothetical protein